MMTSGILNLDKPADWTSHDVVAQIRRLTRSRRVGHAGTLDPMATGVLVVCLGRATRLIEYLVGQPKTYLAEVTLGVSTDTYDATGQVTAQTPVPALSTTALEQALDAFRGPIMQRPPAFSALKRGGEALYKRARRGESIEVAPRPVTIYSLLLTGFDTPLLHLEVTCSAGTYIRSLAHDLGQALGCGAHLSALRRTTVGPFVIDDAITPEQLASRGWQDFLLPIDALVAHLERIVISDAEATRLRHGQPIPGSQAPGDPAAPCRAYDQAGNLLAIVSYDQRHQLWRPRKVLAA